MPEMTNPCAEIDYKVGIAPRDEHPISTHPWEVQCHDATRGVFRAVLDARDNPERFETKAEAIERTQLIASFMAPHHQFRVYQRMTGNIVGFTRRDGHLVAQ